MAVGWAPFLLERVMEDCKPGDIVEFTEDYHSLAKSGDGPYLVVSADNDHGPERLLFVWPKWPGTSGGVYQYRVRKIGRVE